MVGLKKIKKVIKMKINKHLIKERDEAINKINGDKNEE